MKLLCLPKKLLNPPKPAHNRLLLTDPNSLIGYRFDSGRMKLVSVVGVGGNGVVYRAVECFPDDMTQPLEPPHFAVKVISKVGLTRGQVGSLKREFRLHLKVSEHHHIVTCHRIVEEEDFFFGVLDYVPGGDLFDMMELQRAYLDKDELIKSVFLQLIDAVEHIHKLGISHRDIKPENILCQDAGYILLADFGLGTECKLVKDYGVGSEPYMAPECFGGFWKALGPYSAPSTDIWSLGVVLVNLACARNPWPKATGDSELYRAFIDNPNHLLDSLAVSVELNEVLKRMFNINPPARISLKDLRTEVQAIKRFTLTDEELKSASPTVRDSVKKASQARREPTLAPGAPYTLVARQITNLTAEDIERLETEAREDARDASLRQEQEARRSLFACADFDEDEDDYPLFLSPTFSPTPTIVVQDSTPRASERATLDVEPIFVLDYNELEVDSDSDVDSEAPITPESHPTADEDIDIAVVPEIHLDESFLHGGDVSSTLPRTENASPYPITKFLQDEVPGRTKFRLGCDIFF